MTRLLLVEDDDFDRLLFKQRLRRAAPDWVLVEAASLAAARSLLDATPFDLVVADLMLPDADGLGVVRGLLQAGAKRIVVVSGRDDLDASGHEGVVGHLSKDNFDARLLLALVKATA